MTVRRSKPCVELTWQGTLYFTIWPRVMTVKLWGPLKLSQWPYHKKNEIANRQKHLEEVDRKIKWESGPQQHPCVVHGWPSINWTLATSEREGEVCSCLHNLHDHLQVHLERGNGHLDSPAHIPISNMQKLVQSTLVTDGWEIIQIIQWK